MERLYDGVILVRIILACVAFDEFEGGVVVELDEPVLLVLRR